MKIKCSLPWCTNLAHARSWCQTHYSLWHNHGVPNPPLLAKYIATRTLLAKSCTKCGVLKDAAAFQRRNGYYMGWCLVCAGGGSASREVVARNRAKHYGKVQGETLETASNWGKRWTQADEEVAFDPNLTMMEKARLLGRSYKAIDDRIYLHHKKIKEEEASDG